MIQLSENKIKLNSPGKVNLHLAVGGKRDDGFHELTSIFAALDFADTLIFSLLPGNEGQTVFTVQEEGPFLELSQKGQVFPPIPAEKNMVYLASELFRSKTGFKKDLSIELIKRIPPGSGMGGGSSNAATTLLALNEHFNSNKNKIPKQEILEMAAQLGSDVPFFIEIGLPDAQKSPHLISSCARAVGGRGEIINFLPAPPSWGILLAFPGFASHTSAAFNLLDKNSSGLTKKARTNSLLSKDFFWDFPDNWDYSNDFEELFLQFGPEREKETYRTMLADLKNAGASFTGLSGSGSACFGVFSGYEEALKAEKALGGVFYVLKSTFFLR